MLTQVLHEAAAAGANNLAATDASLSTRLCQIPHLGNATFSSKNVDTIASTLELSRKAPAMSSRMVEYVYM